MSSQKRLERIKNESCPNTYDVHYGRTERVDDLMPGDFQWLIEQAETVEKIAKRWIEIEDNGTPEEADDFYTFVQDTLTPESD